MPVHLTGRIAKMDQIMKIAEKYNIPVIEDSAQSIGSLYMGKHSGTFGKNWMLFISSIKKFKCMW